MATILSISLPDDLCAPLDAEARRQRRSRSAVVAEAVRESLARHHRAAFDAARDHVLGQTLALSLADRVKLVSALTRQTTRGHRRPKPFAITFATFAERDAWRRARLGPWK